MEMITGARVVPAVNHVASSTLPTPLMPETKYASIYLLSAGDQEAASKKPHCQSSCMVSQSESDSVQHCCTVQKPLSQFWCVRENVSGRRVRFRRNQAVLPSN